MKKFIILIPLYNDWKSVSKLLYEIDSQINNWDAEVSIIIVNDASTEKKSDLDSNFKKIKISQDFKHERKQSSSKMYCRWIKIYL